MMVGRDVLFQIEIGRDVLFQIEKDARTPGPPLLEVSDLRATDQRGIEALSGVDLTVHEGEIVGVAGVSGNGQMELAETFMGYFTREGLELVKSTADVIEANLCMADQSAQFADHESHSPRRR